METNIRKNKKLRTRWFQIITLCILPTIISSILLTFLISIFLILVQQEIILFQNSNIIHVPNDLGNLFDLNTYSYRNGSLYRYDRKRLILNEDEPEKFEKFMLLKNANEIDRLFSINMENIEDEDFLCDGTCECYNENERERRNVGNLIYSYRFTSVLVFSTIGFAVAKFVNDHLDECYEMAKKVTGNDVGKGGVTCSIEKAECKETELKKKKKNVYCTGHCLLEDQKWKTMNTEELFINYLQYLKDTGDWIEYNDVWAKEYCDSIWYDKVERMSIPIPKQKYTKADDPSIMLQAKRIFVTQYLQPFCTDVSVGLSTNMKSLYKFCKGERGNIRGPRYQHVKCSYKEQNARDNLPPLLYRDDW